MLDLHPNKWLKNSRLPVMNDIVLFVFNGSEYGKGGMDWRLGKITAVNGTQVSVSKFLRGTIKYPLCTLSREEQEIFQFCIQPGICW